MGLIVSSSSKIAFSDVTEYYSDGRIYSTTKEYMITAHPRRAFRGGNIDAALFETKRVPSVLRNRELPSFTPEGREAASPERYLNSDDRTSLTAHDQELLRLDKTDGFGEPEFRNLARAIAKKYDLPPKLFETLIERESAFKPKALSHAGAYGLAQLMPDTAIYLGVDINNPIENLHGGARYLAEQKKAFGKWEHALAAYNAGPKAVEKYGGIPPYKETQNFVSWILDRYGKAVGDDVEVKPPAVAILVTQNVMEFD